MAVLSIDRSIDQPLNSLRTVDQTIDRSIDRRFRRELIDRSFDRSTNQLSSLLLIDRTIDRSILHKDAPSAGHHTAAGCDVNQTVSPFDSSHRWFPGPVGYGQGVGDGRHFVCLPLQPHCSRGGSGQSRSGRRAPSAAALLPAVSPTGECEFITCVRLWGML